jgi:hypothetical protein
MLNTQHLYIKHELKFMLQPIKRNPTNQIFCFLLLQTSLSLTHSLVHIKLISFRFRCFILLVCSTNFCKPTHQPPTLHTNNNQLYKLTHTHEGTHEMNIFPPAMRADENQAVKVIYWFVHIFSLSYSFVFHKQNTNNLVELGTRTFFFPYLQCFTAVRVERKNIFTWIYRFSISILLPLSSLHIYTIDVNDVLLAIVIYRTYNNGFVIILSVLFFFSGLLHLNFAPFTKTYIYAYVKRVYTSKRGSELWEIRNVACAFWWKMRIVD